MAWDAHRFLEQARLTLCQEATTLAALPESLGDDFVRIGERIHNCPGRIVCMGIGKSGLIAAKIAATLSSTGTAAFFVHPNDAVHGDLGMILEEDIILLLSKSGRNDELALLLPPLRRRTPHLIAMTCDADSPLAQSCGMAWIVPVAHEACPLDLAPTASTTAMLACGDALAMALLAAQGFDREKFALTHPAGQLGKRLLARVGDYMRTGVQIPIVAPNASLADALITATSKKLGIVLVCAVGEAGATQCLGVFTDGDLRRSLQQGTDINETRMGDIMSPHFKKCTPQQSAWEAGKLMIEHNISALVVTAAADSDMVVGILEHHDLLQRGVL